VRGVAIGLLLLVSVVGCASTAPNLQRETARVLGTQLSPEGVEVSNIARSLMSVTWTATARGKHYQCSADDMVRRPYCVEAR
jgi:hypothetical protein